MGNWLPALVTGICQLIVAVYVYGKLSERVSTHGERLGKLEESNKDQWRELNQQGQSLAKVKGKLNINGG